MKNVRTSLLIALLLAASLTAMVSVAHLRTAREHAEASTHDLAICRQQLAALRTSTKAPAGMATVGADPVSPLNQLIREAASGTDTTTKLVSIQPGQSARIVGTDYQETPVFVRLDPMPLKQLVTFLYEPSSRDPRVRTRSIELSAAESSNTWSADITMGYLSYSPLANDNRGNENR
jgi:hypothetical protein